MDENKEPKVDDVKTQNYHHHHGLKVLLIVVGCIIILGGLAGAAKMAIGRHGLNQVTVERNVSFGSGNFEGGRGERMIGGREGRGRAGESLIGKISKIDGDTITLHKDSNNKDYAVVISDATQIRKDGDIASKTDLANGQAITVQGSANSSGQITAVIIIIN
ncbi:MAG: DUF5666 domain-containing protein [Candidatus Berkelbacteria bacterium]